MGLLTWIGLETAAEPLGIGDLAPDVAVVDEQGNHVRLADFYRDGYTLIFFFPKADTPGCTKQACGLRDSMAELKAHGVRVVGVSGDTSEAQLRFQQKRHLPFTLLADRDHAAAQAFGVSSLMGLYRRQSFLIKNRQIAWRDLGASTTDHAADVLAALKTLSR